MINKFSVSVLIFLFGFSAVGQIGSVIGKREINNKIVNKQKKVVFSTKKLAYAITRNSGSDSEKSADIYRWIATNISYDNELMRSKDLQRQIYTSEDNIVKMVLDRKMALCGGFALLYKYLCADVGVEAEVVHGFTKDYRGKLKKREVPNHTWNVVKLNGRWQLLDITWAIGHGSENNPDGFWYLTKPSDFIYTHYPQDTNWILLNNSISFTEFEKRP